MALIRKNTNFDSSLSRRRKIKVPINMYDTSSPNVSVSTNDGTRRRNRRSSRSTNAPIMCPRSQTDSVQVRVRPRCAWHLYVQFTCANDSSYRAKDAPIMYKLLSIEEKQKFEEFVASESLIYDLSLRAAGSAFNVCQSHLKGTILTQDEIAASWRSLSQRDESKWQKEHRKRLVMQAVLRGYSDVNLRDYDLPSEEIASIVSDTIKAARHFVCGLHPPDELEFATSACSLCVVDGDRTHHRRCPRMSQQLKLMKCFP